MTSVAGLRGEVEALLAANKAQRFALASLPADSSKLFFLFEIELEVVILALRLRLGARAASPR